MLSLFFLMNFLTTLTRKLVVMVLSSYQLIALWCVAMVYHPDTCSSLYWEAMRPDPELRQEAGVKEVTWSIKVNEAATATIPILYLISCALLLLLRF